MENARHTSAPSAHGRRRRPWRSSAAVGTKVTHTAGGEQGPMTMSTAGNVFQADGALTTTIDGRVYSQPANGT